MDRHPLAEPLSPESPTHGYRVLAAQSPDEIPVPTEASLEREIDALLWALDFDEAVELAESDMATSESGGVR